MEGNSSIDYLTGLYNRKGLYEHFENVWGQENINFMYLDLDNFKTVNDVYGHQAGDKVLTVFAKILQECSPEAIAARMGGDEFVLVIWGAQTREAMIQIAEHIMERVKAEQNNLQYLSIISVSIGIVWNSTDTADLTQLLANSDTAMYLAKQIGKSCYVFFNDMEGRILQEKAMEDGAAIALSQEQFRIYFSPVINLQNSRLEHTTLQINWEVEDTVWMEEDYRPVLERNGFIRNLDLHIFGLVCQYLQALHQEYHIRSKICIQLSRLLFLDDNLAEKLSGLMQQYEIAYSDIELALEETALGNRDNQKIIQNMEKMVKAGFSLALNHFGKDFSAFRYLTQLPIHTIEFDKEYLIENIKDGRGRNILKSLIKMGKEMKFTVTARGISQREDLDFLGSAGCDGAEGSVYTKPLTFEAYRSYVKQKLKFSNECICFSFQNHLAADSGSLEGTIKGKGVTFTKGISDNWGAVHFPGGNAGKNVIYFPERMFSYNSYTISMWIRIEEVSSWGSVLYMRYLEGFASLVPNIGDGVSAFRISEDDNVNVWHDVLCRALALNEWGMLTLTYNTFSETACYYINGRKAAYRLDVPTLLSCRQVILGGDPFQRSFKGDVSGLMVFDHVKTDEEVEKLYRDFVNEPGFCGKVEKYWMDME